jgi:hypothetical protein
MIDVAHQRRAVLSRSYSRDEFVLGLEGPTPAFAFMKGLIGNALRSDDHVQHKLRPASATSTA